VSDTSITDHNR